MAVLGTLAWPWAAPQAGPTAAIAADLICFPPLIVCATPTPTQNPSPKATPTAGRSVPPAPGSPPGGGSNPGSGITNPGDAVGSGPGPAAPPGVNPTGIDVVSDQVNPQPGGATSLTITVSGQKGPDRYGVAGASVDLLMTEQPGTDAQLSATSVTTDAAGAAYVKLTLSRTRGRHVVNVTSATLSAQYVADTLGAGGQVSRARHSGEIAGVPGTQHGSPVPFFVAAGLILVLGFAAPYLRRLAIFRRPAPPGPPPPEPRPNRGFGLRSSSKRTN